MAKKSTTKKCVQCNTQNIFSEFYVSASPLHEDKRVPICKGCLSEIDATDLQSVYAALKAIDKPFITKLWERASQSSATNVFGTYMRTLSLPQNKSLTWIDSDNEQDSVASKIANNTTQIKENQEDEEVSQYLLDKWGHGYQKEEYAAFERKFKLLESSYPIRSTMHLEALTTYCRYRIFEEEATKNRQIKEAKEWGQLAQKAANDAKINPNQLSNSDLSNGMDSFGELTRAVEKAVDIIPILPQFISKPKDKVDFTILCYINYERHCRGLPLVEQSDIYDFYNQMVDDYLKQNPAEYSFLNEVEGDTQVERVYNYVFKVTIPKLKKENPHDPFYQNLDKWVTFVSWSRFYPDLWLDLITPKSGGIRLDMDQRVLLRALARFKSVYGVLPRGYGKTYLEQLSGFHTCVFYPDINISMTAQTKENASALVKDKYSEVMKHFPMLQKETIEKKNRFADNLSEVYWVSGAKIDTLCNNQSTKGARRKRIVIEESALLNDSLFQDVLEPCVNIPRRTIGPRAIVNPLELNGQINFFTTSAYRGSDEHMRNIRYTEDMIELKNGRFIIGSKVQDCFPFIEI